MDTNTGKRTTTPGQVHEQIIENLRRDQAVLQKSLVSERNKHQQELNSLQSTIKGHHRDIQQLAKTNSHLEVKIVELEQELRNVREVLNEERRGAQADEVLSSKALKDLTMKFKQEEDKAARLERECEMLRSELEQANEALSLERKATESMIHEHNKEVKSLREEVHNRSCDAYKELQYRAAKEKEEYRALREENEKSCKLIEQDFRAVIAQKDEELRQARSEIKGLLKEMDEGRRISILTAAHESTPFISNKNAAVNAQQNALVENLRQEVALLKHDIKMRDKKLQAAGDAIFSEVQRERSKYEKVLVDDDKKIRADVAKLVLKSKDQTILRQRMEMLRAKNAWEKLRTKNHTEPMSKKKPQLPAKSAKLLECKAASLRNEKSQRVKDMVKQLQEKENGNSDGKLNGGSAGKKPTNAWTRIVPVDEADPTVEPNNNHNATNKTIADLQAIDEDIEKLRLQIEERDRIIVRLKEETKVKDQKIINLTPLNIQCQKDPDAMSISCSSPESEGSTDSKSSSPIPSTNTNYLELLTKHLRQQRQEQQLHRKSSTGSFNDNETITDDNRNVGCNYCGEKTTESYMALEEEVKNLRKREASLRSEAAELREQNELMEFRILELEECNVEDVTRSLPTCRTNWPDDVSDSGVMSLPTSEDLTSDSDQGDTFGNSSSENKLTGVATVFSNIHSTANRSSSRGKSIDCLQESGIFEDCVASPSESVIFRLNTHCKACQTDSDLSQIKSSKTGDLTAELSKLTEIQKRIQEKGETIGDNAAELRAKSPYSFYISDYIGFYEDKLSQLEEKLEIYESFGDTRDNLLKKRLEKEIFLTYEIRGLKERIVAMEQRNRILEEERCEFEEAENDSRLECQRLQMTVEDLLNIKTELEDKVEKISNETSEGKHRKNRNEQKLRQDVEDLRAEVINYKFRIEELETSLEEKDAKIEAILQIKVSEASSDTKSFISKALGLETEDGKGDASEIAMEKDSELRMRIESLEKSNEAFITALSKADEVWAKMEEDYKSRISNMEKEHDELINVITNQHLENISLINADNEGKLCAMKESEAEKHKAEMEELQKSHECELNTMRSGFEMLLDSSEENIQKLFNEVQEKTSLIGSIKSSYEDELRNEKMQLYDKLLQSEKQIDILKENCNSLQRNCEEVNLRLKEKTVETEAIRTSFDEQLKLEKIKFEETAMETQKVIENLKENCNSLKQSLDEANACLSMASVLKTAHTSLINEMDELREETTKKHETVKTLATDKDELVAKLSALAEELVREKVASQARVAELEEKSRSLTNTMEKDIADLKVELTDKNNIISDYEVTISELREEVETLEALNIPLMFDDNTTVEIEISGSLSQSAADSSCQDKLSFPDISNAVSLLNLQEKMEWRRITKLSLRFVHRLLNAMKSAGSLKEFLDEDSDKTASLSEGEPVNFEEEFSSLSLKNEKLTQLLDYLEDESKRVDQDCRDLDLEIRVLEAELELMLVDQRERTRTLKVANRRPAAIDNSTLQFACDNLGLKSRQSEKHLKSVFDMPNAKSLVRCTTVFRTNIAAEQTVSISDVEALCHTVAHSWFMSDGISDYDGNNCPRIKSLSDTEGDCCSGKGLSGENHQLFLPKRPVNNFRITEVRLIDRNCLYVSWNAPVQPKHVNGYEISINGEVMHCVRSRKRSRAVVFAPNLGDSNVVTVWPLSSKGRICKKAEVVFPQRTPTAIDGDYASSGTQSN